MTPTKRTFAACAFPEGRLAPAIAIAVHATRRKLVELVLQAPSFVLESLFFGCFCYLTSVNMLDLILKESTCLGDLFGRSRHLNLVIHLTEQAKFLFRTRMRLGISL